MNSRREFIRHIALLAAGVAALPEQIAAFTQYYDRNTPAIGPFVAIDEVYMAGMANVSTPMWLEIMCGSTTLIPLGFNAFGGIVMWRAQAEGKIVTRTGDLTWKFSQPSGLSIPDPVERTVKGYVSYIGQDGVRKHVMLDTVSGNITGGR
jgi:hypothetical protein